MAKHRRQRTTFDPVLDEGLLSEPSSLSPLAAIDPTAGFPDPAVLVDDRRRWHPDPDPFPSTVFGSPALITSPRPTRSAVLRMMESGTTPSSSSSGQRRFNSPRQVLECVKRKTRREVMFTLPKRKRRAGAGAKRRRDPWSNIHC